MADDYNDDLPLRRRSPANDAYDDVPPPSRRRLPTEDDRQPARRRPSIMEQRLRHARGEEVPEYDDTYDDDDDYARPRGFQGGSGGGGGSGGNGCVLPTLLLVVGGLAALLIIFFFFNQTFGRIGDAFSGVQPNIAEVLASPTPVIVSRTAVIERIRQLSRLETTSYTVERVIDVSQGSNIPIVGDFLAGDALLLIAHGTIVAGVDLSQLTEDNVTIAADGSTITLTLPPAQIFSSSLDEEKTQVYLRNRGLFAPENKDLESQARITARQEILRAACEDGIMQRATENGAQSVTQFLGLLDFERVEIVPSEPTTCVAPDA